MDMGTIRLNIFMFCNLVGFGHGTLEILGNRERKNDKEVLPLLELMGIFHWLLFAHNQVAYL